ncbi:MAG: ABC transporter ATP-binding protein [Propionibacteriaceae bacterium]|jgi:peptide/nickel transport system ATP-binding protein|nr:ABC transporter ATP-binding protein [Propionibacteriaceae bacterium]
MSVLFPEPNKDRPVPPLGKGLPPLYDGSLIGKKDFVEEAVCPIEATVPLGEEAEEAERLGIAAKPDPTVPVIDAQRIRIWYGTPKGAVRAVDDVSFYIGKGEILGLVGESGSGKSTIGRGLLGLLPDGSVMDGKLEFKGEDLLALTDKERFKMRGRNLAMIFQEPLTRLNPLMRVSEHFTETLRTHFPKMTDAEIEERSLSVLKTIGIPPTRWMAYPHEFSGGMRQRIMIALALVLRPAFVVADEPTTALDVLVEAQIVRILRDLKEEFDTALLLITHNLGIIAEACDRVAVMYAGKIVEIGDAREVFANPQHPYTQELLRSTITLTTDGLHSIPGAPPNLIDPPSGCHFHPRCPRAMKQCALAEPPMRNVHGGDSKPGTTDAACWLNPALSFPEENRAPLEREAIADAEEA